MNILQSLFLEVARPVGPMHVGEAMLLWTLYTGVKESRAICLLMVNHTKDQDLREAIEHFVADVEAPMSKKLSELMLNEGIPLPPTTGDKPPTDESAIPLGAKLTDAEIANLLAVKLDGMLTICHAGLMQGLRPDLVRLFYAFQSHLLAQGFNLKNTMRRRGWLRIPPSFYPEPSARQ